MRIGVVGYSAQAFDKEEANLLLIEALMEIPEVRDETVWPHSKIIQIVSGLTQLGIPAIAYSLAKKFSWKTIGIACEKAYKYECFPCDRAHIIGQNWGDESAAFLASIDVLIRIGGGPQSMRECEMAKGLGIPVIVRELAAVPTDA